MSIDRDKILTRIQKLLNLASGSSEHEAASAAAQAQKLMAKYDLCIEDITEDDEKRATTVIEVEVASGKRMISWVYDLFCAVTDAFGTRTLIVDGYKYKGLKVVGSESDVHATRITFEYLYDTVDRLAEGQAGNGKAFINSYRLGVVASIREKLRAQARANKKEVQAEATEAGTALVLRKDQALVDYMKKFTGSYKPSKQNNMDVGGYRNGMVDGQNVGLDKQLDKGDLTMRFGK